MPTATPSFTLSPQVLAGYTFEGLTSLRASAEAELGERIDQATVDLMLETVTAVSTEIARRGAVVRDILAQYDSEPE